MYDFTVMILSSNPCHHLHLCRKDDWLSVPRGWLCYLAPEIIRALKALQHAEKDLPFTKMSDLYAFGYIFFLFSISWRFSTLLLGS